MAITCNLLQVIYSPKILSIFSELIWLADHRQNASDLWSSFAWYNQLDIAITMNYEHSENDFPVANEDDVCMAMLAATGFWENKPCNTADVYTVCEIVR
jgi:hypothetical protein